MCKEQIEFTVLKVKWYFLVEFCSFSNQTFYKCQNVDFQISMHAAVYLLVFTEGEDEPIHMTDVDNKKISDF